MKWTKIEASFFSVKRWRVCPVLGAVLLISGGLLFINGLADAAGSDRISFASNRTGSFDIYVIAINGESLRNLTNHLTDELGPWVPAWVPAHAWSLDGRFLAYTSNRDGTYKIYVADTGTGEHRRLTHRPEKELAPAWSPDGKWIAFVSGDDYDIYKTDVNGAHLVQLTDFGGNGRPTWSPDGKQIAFFSNKRGKRYSLYIMDTDGKRLKRVPDGSIQAIRGVFRNECAWSPDGKRIAFTLHVPQAQREHLCVIDVDGKNFHQLTRGGIAKAKEAEKRNPVNGQAFLPPPPHPLPEISSPAWSPDGKWIAYVYSDTALWRTADIYVIDAEGNRRGTPLITGARQDLSPAWVPEGFLSISPSAEKQTTLWGKLKQAAD